MPLIYAFWIRDDGSVDDPFLIDHQFEYVMRIDPSFFPDEEIKRIKLWEIDQVWGLYYICYLSAKY